MIVWILIAGCSYSLGSIPFGYILVRLFRGQDVRQTGSGNIGATNVARSSPALGVLTLLLDAAKGLLAVYVATQIARRTSLGYYEPHLYSLMSTAAFFAIVGHMFPVWLKFRGGKGVATGLGAFVVIAPKTVMVMVAIFVLAVLAFRYISLASIVAVALFPLLAWALNDYLHTPLMLGFMASASLLIIAKHHGNIRRLLAGTENRWRWRRG
ncbi:MAG: glycerol-3-phosphate 1-O-acyltransferase PlsY [Acidobacteriia bacterium]|nr:glycerol-3-phosphate 1-O-acyltransferase PlsY [Terriglobia bacterium]